MKEHWGYEVETFNLGYPDGKHAQTKVGTARKLLEIELMGCLHIRILKTALTLDEACPASDTSRHDESPGTRKGLCAYGRSGQRPIRGSHPSSAPVPFCPRGGGDGGTRFRDAFAAKAMVPSAPFQEKEGGGGLEMANNLSAAIQEGAIRIDSGVRLLPLASAEALSVQRPLMLPLATSRRSAA